MNLAARPAIGEPALQRDGLAFMCGDVFDVDMSHGLGHFERHTANIERSLGLCARLPVDDAATSTYWPNSNGADRSSSMA